MARSHAEKLADRFEERFAPLFEAVKSDGTGGVLEHGVFADVTPRSMALVYANRIVNMASALIPDAKQRAALFDWPELARVWSFTDHGILPRYDNDQNFAMTIAIGLIGFAQFNHGSVRVLRWSPEDVQSAVDSLNRTKDPGAIQIAKDMELLEPDEVTVARPLESVVYSDLEEIRKAVEAAPEKFASWTEDEDIHVVQVRGHFEVALAMARERSGERLKPENQNSWPAWTPRECVRLFAALRHAVRGTEPSTSLLLAPTQIIGTFLDVRENRLTQSPTRWQSAPPPQQDLIEWQAREEELVKRRRDAEAESWNGDTFPVAATAHWVLTTQDHALIKGGQISLPFPEQYLDKGDRLPLLPGSRGFQAAPKTILSGSVLRVWLACLALLGEEPLLPKGFFIIEPSHVLTNLLGSPTRINKSKGRLYRRPTDRAETQLRDALRILRRTFILKVGGRNIDPPEALITRWAKDLTKDADDDVYVHAQATMMAIQGGKEAFYTQVPRAVMRLDANDTPLAMALANVWRERIVRDVYNGPGCTRLTLRDLAEKTGEYRENEERKHKLGYWTKVAGRFARVMYDGGLGEAHIAGEGPRAVVTLTPSKILEEAYQRLKTAQDRARVKEQERASAAQIVEAVERRKRPGRRRKRID